MKTKQWTTVRRAEAFCAVAESENWTQASQALGGGGRRGQHRLDSRSSTPLSCPPSSARPPPPARNTPPISRDCTDSVLVLPSHYLNGKENGPLPSSRSDPSLPFKGNGRAHVTRVAVEQDACVY